MPEIPRVPVVEPELMTSAIFLFREYLAGLAAAEHDDDDEADADALPGIETGAVLDLFAGELATNVPTTLALYLRVTALFRLLAASPTLAGMAIDPEEPDDTFTEDAVLAAARLDLHVTRRSGEGAADFDPREFRDALSTP